MIKRLIGLAGCAALLLSNGALAPLSSRAFHLTYDVQLGNLPEGGKKLRVWIPLAASSQYQKIRSRTISCAFPYQVTQDPEYGNSIFFLPLKNPLPSSVSISVDYEVQVLKKEFPLGRETSAKISSQEMGLYLKPTRYMVIDDQVRSLARAVTAGASTTAERAHRIYRFCIERMRYDKETPGWGSGDTLRACRVGAGNCTDFHSLFISLARASGIPAQFRIGLPLSDKPEGEIPGYHCWAEFYLPGVGWVPVDASEAWKDRKRLEYFFGNYDPNRFALSAGRDVQLVPKPANGPINIFFFPYAEIDGTSMEKERIKTTFRFRDIQSVQESSPKGELS